MPDLPRPGAHASVTHVFTRDDIAEYARLSGDDNPVHLDPAAARAAGFDDLIAHGALVMGLFSRLLGTQLPGPGTIYLGQELRFSRPIYADVTLTAHVEVVSLREDKPVVTLRTWVEAADATVIDGIATVLVRSLTPRPPAGDS
jgi:acyl dehydratase